MKNLKKWQALTLLLVSVSTLNACGKSNAECKQASSTSNIQQKTEISKQHVQKSTSQVQSVLDKAKKAGKAVFVVVTGTGVTNIEKATAVANGAKSIYKNAAIVQLNRDDKANSQLVSQFRLAGAPLPLILVISSKGLPTGGYTLEQATAENIAALVPSPKLEVVYEAVANGKHAIVVFSKKTFADRKEVINISKKAVSMLNNEAVFVEVDMDSPKEASFMDQLRIDKLSTKASVTLVINKQGQIAGTSKTVPDAAKLVAAAKTPVKGGCGSGCGPAGCAK